MSILSFKKWNSKVIEYHGIKHLYYSSQHVKLSNVMGELQHASFKYVERRTCQYNSLLSSLKQAINYCKNLLKFIGEERICQGLPPLTTTSQCCQNQPLRTTLLCNLTRFKLRTLDSIRNLTQWAHHMLSVGTRLANFLSWGQIHGIHLDKVRARMIILLSSPSKRSG